MGSETFGSNNSHSSSNFSLSEDKNKIDFLLGILKSIENGGGSDPRIYAANSVYQYNQAIIGCETFKNKTLQYKAERLFSTLESISNGGGSHPRIYAGNTVYQHERC
jgi:hypothetical protein